MSHRRTQPGAYVVATIHREANVRPERLRRIAEGLSRIEEPVVLPAHPRTASVLEAHGIPLGANVELREPMGYLAFASAASQARVVATDSGGLQKEAYWYRVPCVTMRPSTEWVDTVAVGANVLVDDDPHAIAEAVRAARFPPDAPPLYGDGHAAATGRARAPRVAGALEDCPGSRGREQRLRAARRECCCEVRQDSPRLVRRHDRSLLVTGRPQDICERRP